MKDPAVLFYTQDFITGTLLMTNEQRGKYILLLCLQHQNGKLSERDMLKVCGEKDEDIWSKFVEDEGYFYNERMLKESSKRKKFTDSRRANAKHMPKHMENENEDVNVIEDKNEDYIEFEVFWNLFDKKEDKVKCEAKWNKLKHSEQLACIEALPAYIRSTPDKQYRKNPATYLNNKSWENEIIKPQPVVTDVITYNELLHRFNNGETDMWDKYEAVKINGKNMFQRKTAKI